MSNKKKGIIIGCIAGVVVLLLGGILSIRSVPANTAGVKYNKFSGVQDGFLKEGVYFTVPFVEKIYKIDTKVQERTDEGVSIQTKDSQFVSVVVNVKYKVEPANVVKIFKNYGSLDSLQANIIGNYTQNALNEVCSEYNVIELLGEKRNEAVAKTKENLRDKFAKEGVTMVELTIKDMDAGDAIEKAISDEAVAKKAAETAKQKQETARNDAETKRIQAQGEADANRILSESITDELIRLKEAEARMKHGWITVQGAGSVIADNK